MLRRMREQLVKMRTMQVDVLMMARQVGPRGSKPENWLVLQGRSKDEAFSGEFH